MDRHVGDYFQEFSDEGKQGLFHRVVALHKSPDVDWETIQAHAPGLPRAWYELAGLEQADRLEFIRGFWLSSLPFQPHTHEALADFFARVDDIGVFITQDFYNSAPDVQMVYSLKGDSGFFRAYPPAQDADIETVQALYGEHIIPSDYAAFLKVHNGFGKYTDTGIARIDALPELHQRFHAHLQTSDPLVLSDAEAVDHKGLFPFYESFGMNCFQCFWAEWFPEQEMGNVYYSGIEHSVADYRLPGSWSEKLAFPTFLDWLVFYVESVE